MGTPLRFVTPLATALSLVIGGCAQPDCGPAIDGPVPSKSFMEGAMASPNQAAALRLTDERAADEARDLWLAVVPGASEQWGHHKAPPLAEDPDGTTISDEFRARLDMAWLFFDAGHVRFILVSGGAVDAERPDYVEALRGKDYLVREHEGAWEGEGPLEERILVDPLAEKSTTNIRNADKLAVDLGLHRTLIVTTMPPGNSLSASGLATQGFYFLEHDVSTFDARCHSDFGYRLGEFRLYSARGRDGEYLEGIAHCQLSVEELRKDAYGP
jgi:hypothetical protein